MAEMQVNVQVDDDDGCLRNQGKPSGQLDLSFNTSDVINAEFDTDNEEESFDESPLSMDWVDLTNYKLPADGLAITSLPGCRFSETWRNLDQDIAFIKSQGITNVMSFCTKGDLNRCRVKNLLEKYAAAGLEVHDCPHEDMIQPEIENLMKIIEQLELNLNAGKKTLMHCCVGLGRSCLVAACLMMLHNPELEPEKAIENIRSIRGHRAVQSIKQFNFITDFRTELNEFLTKTEEATARALSR
ncbi:cyclin-dependent kinase inhibitor 3-like [Lineus longissimus]|uniref:cyclin-dependent kinase inhibitor 3-like n=1 Tax=Lineus longissimus TaxID=88925 RepID=UPI002B4E96F9